MKKQRYVCVRTLLPLGKSMMVRQRQQKCSVGVFEPLPLHQVAVFPIATIRRIAELREALVEEGRRRRQLYDEKRWAAQSELRRVLSEKVAVQEKEGMLRLMLKVPSSKFLHAYFGLYLLTKPDPCFRRRYGTPDG